VHLVNCHRNSILDTTPPVIRAPSDVATDSINGSPAIATLGTATATDLFPVTITNDAPASYSAGTTTVTWTATDANGNSASATQRVIVALIDTLPPVVTAPADVFATSSSGNAAVNLGVASANDNIDGMVGVINNAPASFPIGVTTVTWTAADAAGNVGTAIQRVVVSYLPMVGGGGGGGTAQPPVPGGGATVTTEAVYWHHNDHLGTPQALTDVSGRKVWEMSQTPFGIGTPNEDPDGDGITVTNNFRFPGQYFDAETGLNYNYFRTFDPNSGRYTQSDPIGLRGGLNAFSYVGANPISNVDPNGLINPLAIIGGAIGGVSGAIQAANSGGGWNSANATNIITATFTGAAIGVSAGFVPTQWGPLAAMATGALAGASGNLAGQATSWALDPCLNSFDPDYGAMGTQALLGGSSALLGFSSGLGYALQGVRAGSPSAAAIMAGDVANGVTAGAAQIVGNNFISTGNGGYLP